MQPGEQEHSFFGSQQPKSVAMSNHTLRSLMARKTKDVLEGKRYRSAKSKQTKDKENRHTRCKVGAGLCVDRGNRWRDRERNDTHYTQNQMYETGEGWDRAWWERQNSWDRRRFAENNGLRKTGIRTYCSLEKSQSSCISTVRKERSFEKQLNTFFF